MNKDPKILVIDEMQHWKEQGKSPALSPAVKDFDFSALDPIATPENQGKAIKIPMQGYFAAEVQKINITQTGQMILAAIEADIFLDGEVVNTAHLRFSYFDPATADHLNARAVELQFGHWQHSCPFPVNKGFAGALYAAFTTLEEYLLESKEIASTPQPA